MAAGKDGTEFLILKLWPELAAVVICFHKESMLLITDGHMNTWKIVFIKVTNILCAKFCFFHLQTYSVLLLFEYGRIQAI